MRPTGQEIEELTGMLVEILKRKKFNPSIVEKNLFYHETFGRKPHRTYLFRDLMTHSCVMLYPALKHVRFEKENGHWDQQELAWYRRTQEEVEAEERQEQKILQAALHSALYAQYREPLRKCYYAEDDYIPSLPSAHHFTNDLMKKMSEEGNADFLAYQENSGTNRLSLLADGFCEAYSFERKQRILAMAEQSECFEQGVSIFREAVGDKKKHKKLKPLIDKCLENVPESMRDEGYSLIYLEWDDISAKRAGEGDGDV